METAMLKDSLVAAPARSVAATLMPMVPTLAAVGVPLNVLVDALNVSQVGRAVPSVDVAV